MSKRTVPTLEVFGKINHRLQEFTAEGKTLSSDFFGRPSYEVDSLNPLVYRQYGYFANRAPQLAGRFAIRGLFHLIFDDTVVVPYAVLDGNASNMFGVHVGRSGLDAMIQKLELPYKFIEE